SARDSIGYQNIFFILPDGTGKIQRTTGPDHGLPSWSPDGRKLTYVSRNPQTGISYVCVMNADGSGQHPVVKGTTPAWAPGGGTIAYASGDGDPPAIWVITADGRTQRRVTVIDGKLRFHPTWAPDGTKLAYALFDPALNRGAIWITNLSGNAVALTTG